MSLVFTRLIIAACYAFAIGGAAFVATKYIATPVAVEALPPAAAPVLIETKKVDVVAIDFSEAKYPDIARRFPVTEAEVHQAEDWSAKVSHTPDNAKAKSKPKSKAVPKPKAKPKAVAKTANKQPKSIAVKAPIQAPIGRCDIADALEISMRRIRSWLASLTVGFAAPDMAEDFWRGAN